MTFYEGFLQIFSVVYIHLSAVVLEFLLSLIVMHKIVSESCTFVYWKVLFHNIMNKHSININTPLRTGIPITYDTSFKNMYILCDIQHLSH